MRTSSHQQDLRRSLVQISDQVSVVVVGEPGAGKTALLNELAQAGHVRTVAVPVNPTEARVPNSGLDVCIAALQVVAGGTLAENLRNVLDDGDPDSVVADRFMHHIRSVELDHEILMIIDGADHFDERSQVILGYLMRRLTGSPLRCVISVDRSHAHGPFAGVRRCGCDRWIRSEPSKKHMNYFPILPPKLLK